MGGRSSSSSAQTNTTQQTDARIGASDSALVIKDASGTTINNTVTDFGALGQALSAFEDLPAAAFDFGRAAIAGVSGAQDKALAFAAEATKTADERSFQDLVKWGALSALALFAFQAVRK